MTAEYPRGRPFAGMTRRQSGDTTSVAALSCPRRFKGAMLSGAVASGRRRLDPTLMPTMVTYSPGRWGGPATFGVELWLREGLQFIDLFH